MLRVGRLMVIGLFAAGAHLAQPAPAQAADLNCTAGCSFVEYAGLLWTTEQFQPAGTGYIDSFLRIQRNSDEEGMNTDFRPVANDEKTDPNYTRDVQLSEIPQKLIEGVLYYELMLDINEPAPASDPTLKSYISLVGLELCSSPIGNQYVPAGGGCDDGAGGATTTKRYNMDEAGGSAVDLDYSLLSTGSGGTDLWVYVPVSFFPGLSPNTYFYLWSQFGFIDGGSYKSQDGFEEWAVWNDGFEPPDPLNPVPEPASLLLFGTGLAAAGLRLRRTRRRG